MVSSCSTFLPSITKTFQRVFKLQGGQEILRSSAPTGSNPKTICLPILRWEVEGGGEYINIMVKVSHSLVACECLNPLYLGLKHMKARPSPLFYLPLTFKMVLAAILLGTQQ